MKEQILAIARQLTGAAESEWSYLETLCDAETARLEKQLRRTPEDAEQSMFQCAAAWLAAADYFSGKGGSGAARWSAGDVTVQERDTASYAACAQSLRAAAAQLLQGLDADGGFAFLGVRG